MNPEKLRPKTEQIEQKPPKVIERLEGQEEDIKRVPLRLREISNAEFQQKFGPEQRERAQTALREVIASSKYNTFNLIEPIFDEYREAVEDSRIISLAELLEKQDVAGSDDNENGIMCAGMALKMKKHLKEQGVNAHLMRYAATGQINEAGNEYAGIGHISTVIPSIQEGKKMFTIIDAGLLVPRPITFEDQHNSELIYFRNKQCQVQYDPENKNFPYKFVIAEQVKNRETGEVEMDEQGEPIYQVTDVASIDPYHEILNPYTAVKDSMRALPGYRLTAQDEEGGNKALVALDLARKQIKLRHTLTDGTQMQERISFGDVRLLESDDRLAEFLKQTAEQLGVSEEYILQNLENITHNYDLYVDQFLAPSVRKELKETEHFQAYSQEITSFLKSSEFSEQERALLKIFFKKVLPSYAWGKIAFHEHEYPLRFSTLVNFGVKEIRIPPMNELDQTEETRFGDTCPTLRIPDPPNIAESVLRFLQTVREQKEKLFWLKSREHYSDEDVLRNALTQIWFNANEYDFANPEQFLDRQIRILQDRSFGSYEDETNLGNLGSMRKSSLVVRRVPQSGSNESPFMMNIELHSEGEIEGELGRADLPSIRYSVETDENGEKTAYVYAIQKQKNEYDDEASQRLQKKINRQLFNLNKGVLDAESDEFQEYYQKRKAGKLEGSEEYPENISDVSPSAVFSLTAFIALLKKEGIEKIKVPAFLPLRWQAHERLGKEEQERIQENMSDKFIRTFQRITHHFRLVKIISHPEDGDGYLYVNLSDKPMEADNPILNDIAQSIK